MPFNPIMEPREGWEATHLYDEVPREQGRTILGFVRLPDGRVFHARSLVFGNTPYFAECARDSVEIMIEDGVLRPVASFEDAQKLLQDCSRTWRRFPFHIFPPYDTTIRRLFR